MKHRLHNLLLRLIKERRFIWLKVWLSKLFKRDFDKQSVRKVLVLNPYIPTMGGGEKHMVFLCQAIESYYPHAEIELFVFNAKEITIHHHDYPTIAQLNTRFDTNLQRTRFLKQPTLARLDFFRLTRGYDLFVNFMFLSTQAAMASRNIYVCMFPPPCSPTNRIENSAFRASYSTFLSNSKFTEKWFHRYWGNKNTALLYPPVFNESRLSTLYNEDTKKNIILAVGRFFVGGHSKRQDVLVDIFKQNRDAFAGWELHLVGAVEDLEMHQQYVASIKEQAAELPVTFHINAPSDELLNLYDSAKIFWHATGFGSDPEKDPIKMEHFGITTVEAMSYGLVPVVHNRGGQTEIVANKKNGFLWDHKEGCVTATVKLIEDDALRKQLAQTANHDAARYSIERFEKRCHQLFATL